MALLEGEQLVDCMEVRFGLRTIGTRQHEILLNGEPLKSFVMERPQWMGGWLKGNRIGILRYSLPIVGVSSCLDGFLGF